MSEKVTVTAILRAKPGKELELRKFLLGLRPPTLAEKGCINYDLHESLSEPGLFLFHENWASRADLDAHGKSPHLLEWRKRSADLLAEPGQVVRWTEIAS